MLSPAHKVHYLDMPIYQPKKTRCGRKWEDVYTTRNFFNVTCKKCVSSYLVYLEWEMHRMKDMQKFAREYLSNGNQQTPAS